MFSTVLASSWVCMYLLFKLKLSWELTCSTSSPRHNPTCSSNKQVWWPELNPQIPWWKERTNSCLFSSDLHTHTTIQVHLHKEGGRNRGTGKRIYNKIKEYSLLSHFSWQVSSLSHKLFWITTKPWILYLTQGTYQQWSLFYVWISISGLRIPQPDVWYFYQGQQKQTSGTVLQSRTSLTSDIELKLSFYRLDFNGENCVHY